MGRIIKELLIKGNKGEKNLNVLFDSGASETIMNEKVAKDFCDIQMLESPRIFTLPNGEKLSATGMCVFETQLESESDLKIGITGLAYTSPEYKDDKMLIGAPLLQEYEIELKFSKDGDKIDLSKAVRHVDYL